MGKVMEVDNMKIGRGSIGGVLLPDSRVAWFCGCDFRNVFIPWSFLLIKA